MKSNSTKGGGGYNEIVIVDGKAGELIRIHAQKDLDTTVEHDDTHTVVNDMTTTVVEGNQLNVVQTGTQSDFVEKQIVMQSISEGISILAKQLILVESEQMIVLQVGDSSITITPNNIILNTKGTITSTSDSVTVIKGSQVVIN